jgi:hypothetical protein
MVREEKERESTRYRVRKCREKKSNAKVTPPSSSSSSCTKVHSVRSGEKSPSELEAFITLTLNDKTEYPIYENQIMEFEKLYPGVDVRQSFRSMRGWCINNPKKRKTKSGIMKFVNAWLAREQDSGKPDKSRASPKMRSQVPDFL